MKVWGGMGTESAPGSRHETAWRSDPVKWQDLQLHDGNAGIPRIGGDKGRRERERSGTKSYRFNDQLDTKTSFPNKNDRASDQQQEDTPLRRWEQNQLPVHSPSCRLTLSTHYIRLGPGERRREKMNRDEEGGGGRRNENRTK